MTREEIDLLDKFAAAAMVGVMANWGQDDRTTAEKQAGRAAHWAYVLAEAMLVERAARLRGAGGREEQNA